MFCTAKGIMGKGIMPTKSSLFDLKAVDFEARSSNCLAIVSPTNSREVFYKINTSMNAHHLIAFLKTLQTMQSDFEIQPADAAVLNIKRVRAS